MPAFRTAYKVVRSFLFTAILIVAGLYVCLYVVLSVPSVQRSVKHMVEKEVSSLLGSTVNVGSLSIFPFNEVRLSDVDVYTPSGERCISIGTLGAGIHLWKLVYERRIEITYAEVVGLDGKVWRKSSKSPLNIDFIIRALSPKDKSKPPTKFDVKLYNVVIRKSKLSYDILDAPRKEDSRVFDVNHVILDDFKADVALPRIKNDDFVIDLRRLSFTERCGFCIEKLGLKAEITPQSLKVSEIVLRLPQTELKVSDINLKFKSFDKILDAVKSGNHLLQLTASRLAFSDFSYFYKPLGNISGEYRLDADISGNLGDVEIEQFWLRNSQNLLNLSFEGFVTGLPVIKEISGDIRNLEFYVSSDHAVMLCDLAPGVAPRVQEIIRRAGNVEINASGKFSMPQRSSVLKADLFSGIGGLDADCQLTWDSPEAFEISGNVASDDLDLKSLLADNRFGSAGFNATADLSIRKKEIDVTADAIVPHIDFNGETINDISFSGEKNGNFINGYFTVNDESVNLDADADIILDKDRSQWRVNADIRKLVPSDYNLMTKYKGYNLSGVASVDLTGNNIDNITGRVNLNDLSFEKSGKNGFHLPALSVTSEKIDSLKVYKVDSDIIEGSLSGDFEFRNIVSMAKNIAGHALPSLLTLKDTTMYADNAALALTVHPNDELAKFLSLPVRPYTDIDVSASLDGEDGRMTLCVEAPYMVKGESKMIRGSRVNIEGGINEGLRADIQSTVPAKNDDANLSISLSALNDDVHANIGWTFEKNKTAEGNLAMGANIHRNEITGKPDVTLKVSPSSFRLNGSEWLIDRSALTYSDGILEADNVRIWHAGQFVNINGRASSSPMDALRVKLAGIDLSYIFEALNINYVTFGGIATGEVLASQLFSKVPVLRTNRLFVKDLSYNGAVLGDGNLESHWINDQKKVAINADIRRGRHRVALIGGGVYIGRDSLSFDMLADHVNIEFLKPFMSAFTSDVGGEASGRVKLYGTFKDIDLKGRVFADSISMKVDYTNVYYHGSDSVFITPGNIDIPSFRLYDKYGNSALLKGVVQHRYFHEPEFEFKLSAAHNLLCYDTNNKINPDWFGRIFASGGGSLRGRPGIVSMMLDVSTTAGSDFTFVLSETQTASDYTFLTFSDKKKAIAEELEATVDLEEKFKKSLPKVVPDRPSLFTMDIRCTVTPAARMNLVMDPKAGDRITAKGGGPMQISYDTDSDEMKIYGKYTLEEGNYNFSLQDLILRDFKIYPGSNISFNGDPMQGILDITAAYRVNTNLSDLDKSFSTDRDLNRTNVPVDALLKVNGDMRGPEITFDIALPTLTQDVERKVKSIISTDDMMNRQIIYLLALNRFYTPEYMGATSNGGGELASVASSTLSSQLSSFMGQLTDKVTLAPSFRSDKGDFSDMEVDVALSSRLLDNRLLINGNFGYRDRSTSQSTFVGDFDIEYLLNKNGDLRLKAYNHFNDQNYYLRSALTTQGIGVIYRKDFDNPFTFLKRKKRKTPLRVNSKAESIVNESQDKDDKK